MPIEAAYEWRQTLSLIVIEIPLKGSSASAVNIIAADCYVKVSFDRYLLHLDLLQQVDDEKCVAKIKNGKLTLKITKKESQMWDSLLIEGLDKAEIKARRAAALEAKSSIENENFSKAKDRKIEDEHKALRKQMALEEDERQHIDDLKSEEKRLAEETIFKAIAQDQNPDLKETKPKMPKCNLSNKTIEQSKNLTSREEDSFGDFDNDEINNMLAEKDDHSEEEDGKEEEDYEMVEVPFTDDEPDIEESYAPSPRTGGVVKFNFTPRIFPTPMRESKQYEEEDWIAKNRNHLRNNPTLRPQLDALDIGDSDPIWLKGKGDDYYRGRDYRAALNAYTTALEISPSMTAVLANRGACHLQLGELVRCIEDCDALLTALDVESMGVDANPSDVSKLGMRVKALTRRGAAKCAQGRFDEALSDLKLASYLSPSDQSLDSDLIRVSSLAHCDKLKKEADASLGAGDLSKALETYSSVLSVDGSFVSALSNRGACHLAMGHYEECVKDCTEALALLAVDPNDTTGLRMETSPAIATSSGMTSQVPSGPVPPCGSTKRRTWVLKTVTRRGVALSQLGKITDAIDDYRLACKLDESNEDLKRDLQDLEQQLGDSGKSRENAENHTLEVKEQPSLPAEL
jgi:dyslexia susceptibility 1 candidate gene 1 protein